MAERPPGTAPGNLHPKTERTIQDWQHIVHEAAEAMPADNLRQTIDNFGARLYPIVANLEQGVRTAASRLTEYSPAQDYTAVTKAFDRARVQPPSLEKPLEVQLYSTTLYARDIPSGEEFVGWIERVSAKRYKNKQDPPSRPSILTAYNSVLSIALQKANRTADDLFAAHQADQESFRAALREARGAVFRQELTTFWRQARVELTAVRNLANYQWQHIGRFAITPSARRARALQQERLGMMWASILRLQHLMPEQRMSVLQALLREEMTTRGVALQSDPQIVTGMQHILAGLVKDVHVGLSQAEKQLFAEGHARFEQEAARRREQAIYKQHIDLTIRMGQAQGKDKNQIYRELLRRYHPASTYQGATPSAEACAYIEERLGKKKRARDDTYIKDYVDAHHEQDKKKESGK